MAIILLLVLCACFLYTLFGGSAAKSLTGTSFKTPFRVITSAYVWVVVVLLGFMIYWYIGFQSTGSQRIPIEKQRRIQHYGYYFARDGQLVLHGRSAAKLPLAAELEKEFNRSGTVKELDLIRNLLPTNNRTENEKKSVYPRGDEGFLHPAFETGEFMSLKPDWQGATAKTWTVTYQADTWPLRVATNVNGKRVNRCVNIPTDRWLTPGESILITRTTGNEQQFVTVRWTSQAGLFGRIVNSFFYGAGVLSQNSLEYKVGPELLMSEVVMTDGFRLSDVIRRGKPEAQKAARRLDEDWWSILEGVAFVREIRDDVSSRLGINIAGDVWRHPGIKIYKTDLKGKLPLTPVSKETSITIPSLSSVIYGLGYQNSIELKLPERVEEDPAWNQVVYVYLAEPPSWPLPKDPTAKFIFTSANDYIPLDGYFIDVGDSRHAFFAKGWLNPPLDKISVNDGKNIQYDQSDPQKNQGESARVFGLGEPISLGDFQQGVLVSLVATRPSVTFAGLKAFAMLVLGAIFLTFHQLKDTRLRPKLLLIWSLIWGFLVSILSVRLILAYRASLITPFNANAREIQNIFGKALTLSIYAFAIVAGLILILPLLVRVLRWFGEQAWFNSLSQKRPLIIGIAILWMLFLIIWIIVGAKISGNQTFLDARINTEVHLLLILGMIMFAKLACDGNWLMRVLIIAMVTVALGIQVLFIHDGGSIIYGVSLAIAIWVLLFWNSLALSSYSRLRRIIGLSVATAPLAMVLLLLLVPKLFGAYLTESRFLHGVKLPNIPETTFYRFASFTDSEESLLRSRDTDGETKMGLLLNNSLQNWQMLLYGSQGASAASGYGQAPLSKRGMTYATSMTDCVFSTYLLAEHGTVSSVVIIIMFAAFGSVLMFAGWHLPDDLIHRVVPLVAIGAYFSCNALYMSGANVGLTVFTGQNIPMLGMHSLGDLLQSLILVAMAGCLLLTPETDAGARDGMTDRPVAATAMVFAVIATVIWTAGVAVSMRALGKQKKYRDDHNFSRQFFKGINDDLPAWKLDNQDKMAPQPGATTQEVERRYADQFNDRADKFNPTGGLYYLEQGRDDAGQNKSVLKVNRRYFYTRSPFRDPAIWSGELVSGGNDSPSISALGGRLTINLQDNTPPKTIDLTGSLPVRAPSRVLLGEGGNQFCELKRSQNNGDELSLDPLTRSDEWSVFVDGRKISSIVQRLEPLSIIVIERKKERFRINLIYLGIRRPILSFARWRNGGQQRIFTEPDFPLSYLLSKSMDAAVQNEDQDVQPALKLQNVSTIKLTIDQGLQRDLQDSLVQYAANHPIFDANQLEPHELGVTALDAFSGAVLAVPSWPLFDPSKHDFESLLDRLPESTRSRFLYNHNLTNHVAGSTIKPLVFGAMATKLYPVGFDLSKMTIFNRADSYSGRATHPHLQVGKIKIDLWDCNHRGLQYDMTDFLSHSRDYPEGVIGMLGMLLNAREVDNVLLPTEKAPDITYEGRKFEFDLTKTSSNDTAFTLGDQQLGRLPKTTGPDTINQTILYDGLRELFDFDNGQDDSQFVHLSSLRFLPTLNRSQSPLEQNLYIDNVIPGRMNMSGGAFQEIRGGLISCLLGGGDCGFNNVRMAQAAARLALGQRIFATLEDSQGSAQTGLFEPLTNDVWRNDHIITPMQLAGEEGTAASFKDLVRLPSGFRAMYKTGTILEGNGIRESETLMFVLGKWENNGFVRGETVAGYLYMEKSKDKKNEPGAKDTSMKKFAFATPILNRIVEFLVQRGRNS